MQIAIHDEQQIIVDYINTDLPESLNVQKYEFKAMLDTGTATSSLSLNKHDKMGRLDPRAMQLTPASYYSFWRDGRSYLFNITNYNADGYSIDAQGELLNMALLYSTAPKLENEDEYSIEDYFNIFGVLSQTNTRIGKNELEDEVLALTFENEETYLKRIQSIVSAFGGELEFWTELHENGQLKSIVIDIYRGRTPNNPEYGRGVYRDDVRLDVNDDIGPIKQTVDKTDLFNALVLVDKDGLPYVFNHHHTLKNMTGKNDIYVSRRSHVLYAPLSVKKYPAFISKNTCDNWIYRKLQVTDEMNEDQLWNYASGIMYEHMYPKTTFSIDTANHPALFDYNVAIGDTLFFQDLEGFDDLIVSARITSMTETLEDGYLVKSVELGSYMAVKSQVPQSLRDQVNQMFIDSLPYDVELTVNGNVVFKNQNGESTITARLVKNGVSADNARFDFLFNDEFEASGETLIVNAKSLQNDILTVTVVGYIDGDEMARKTITFTNVNDGADGKDGKDGKPGANGKDGIAGKDGVGIKNTAVVYGISDNENTPPSSYSSQVPTLVKGKYLWTRTTWTYTDTTQEESIQKTYIAKDGNTGKDGIAGKDGVGIRSTKIQYLADSQGVKPPVLLEANTTHKYNPNSVNHWVSDIVGKRYTDLAEGDFVKQPQYPEIYRISNIRSNGGNADNPGLFDVGPSVTWYTDVVPYVAPGQFLWTRTVWTYTDNTQETGYSVSKIGEKGDKGDKGDKGPAGANGKDGRSITNTEVFIYILDSATPPLPEAQGWKPYDYHLVNGDIKGKYIHYKTVFTYSDGAKSNMLSVTYAGTDGATGQPGAKGADGRTPYFHTAWSNSADGRTGFSTTDSRNKRFMGTMTDFTEADNQDPARYKWTALFDPNSNATNLVAGFIPNTSTSAKLIEFGGAGTNPVPWGDRDRNIEWLSDGWSRLRYTNNTNAQMRFDVAVPNPNPETSFISKDKEYTLMLETRNDKSTDMVEKFYLVANDKTVFFGNTPGFAQNGDAVARIYRTPNPTNGQRIEDMMYICMLNSYVPAGATLDVEIRFSLYLGHYSGDYMPYRGGLDYSDDIKNVQSLTQEQLNALNEQTELIRSEMEAKATAEELSDFIKTYQDFVSSNEEAQKRSEQDLIDAAKRITQLDNKIGDMAERWSFIDTYMQATNEGLVFGKNDGSSTIKISEDRISMMSAGSEVMYISQGVIHIENGIFSKTIQIGRFREEQYSANPDMNVIRYVGGI